MVCTVEAFSLMLLSSAVMRVGRVMVCLGRAGGGGAGGSSTCIVGPVHAEAFFKLIAYCVFACKRLEIAVPLAAD